MDIRISIDFFTHPKTISLETRLGAKGVLCLLRLWAYAREHFPEGGTFYGCDEMVLSRVAGWSDQSATARAFVEALCDRNNPWLEKTEDGDYRIIGWLDHQGVLAPNGGGECQPVKAPDVPDMEFEQWWAAYPKQEGKDEAWIVWKHLKKQREHPSLGRLHDALSEQLQSPDWTKENGQYIPSAARYLREKRWEDALAPRGDEWGGADAPSAAYGSFDQWWSRYPKKKGYAAAVEAWKNAEQEHKLPDAETLLKALDRHVRSLEWTKDNGKYIPWPARYLKEMRWNEELTPPEHDAKGKQPGQDDNPSGEFEQWWSGYPKKIGYASAWQAWREMEGKRKLPGLQPLLEALAGQVASADWSGGNRKYIPAPAKYLKEMRWKDELYASKEAAGPVGQGDAPDNAFEEWWEVYPRQVGREAAWQAWKQMKARGRLPAAETLTDALRAQVQSREWNEDNGKYIPSPAKYLREGRWTDILTQGAEPAGRPRATTVAQEGMLIRDQLAKMLLMKGGMSNAKPGIDRAGLVEPDRALRTGQEPGGIDDPRPKLGGGPEKPER